MRYTVILVALVTLGCGASPAAPAPVPAPVVVPACQAQSTGTVYFQNHSATNLTYDVVWDGAKLTTLPPGTDSQVYTFAANIQHSLQFKITNTSTLACNPGAPILTVCGSTFYGCTG